MNVLIRIVPEHLMHSNGNNFIAFFQRIRIDDIEHLYCKIVL